MFCLFEWIYVLLSYSFGIISEKSLHIPVSWSFSPVFFCRSFIVLAIAFRSLIHFELILYNFCVQCKIRTCFYSLACGCPVFSIYLWQDCVSALKHTLLAPLSKVAHHCICEGLFWGSVFYSLVSSCQYHTVLIRVTL